MDIAFAQNGGVKIKASQSKSLEPSSYIYITLNTQYCQFIRL